MWERSITQESQWCVARYKAMASAFDRRAGSDEEVVVEQLMIVIDWNRSSRQLKVWRLNVCVSPLRASAHASVSL